MSFQYKPEPWTEHANCQNVHDPEIFFPHVAFANGTAPAEPRAICNTCQVKTQCLDYGRRMNAQGVWGGVYLTGNERTPRT